LCLITTVGGIAGVHYHVFLCILWQLLLGLLLLLLLLLTSFNRPLLEKLIDVPLVEAFSPSPRSKPKVCYRVHKSPPLDHINPVHNLTPYFIFVLILYSHLWVGLPSCSLPVRFTTKILYAFLICPMRATYPVHFIIVYYRSLFGEGSELWSCLLHKLCHPSATSSLLASNILLPDALSLCYCVTVSCWWVCCGIWGEPTSGASLRCFRTTMFVRRNTEKTGIR
jgi:hypothetical protein